MDRHFEMVAGKGLKMLFFVGWVQKLIKKLDKVLAHSRRALSNNLAHVTEQSN